MYIKSQVITNPSFVVVPSTYISVFQCESFIFIFGNDYRVEQTILFITESFQSPPHLPS